MDTLPVVPLLNLPLHNVSFDDFLHQLEEGVVFTPNVDHFMKVQKDEAFYRLYQQADYRVCDSRIVQLVSRWLDQPSIVEQIAGSDFFPAYCFFHRHHTDRVRVFLLGGREGAGRMAMENLNRKTQSQIIVGYDTPPMGFEQDPAQRDRIIAKIKASGA
ncbi:MAG: WecB/TagA/CpsF family glycosyltransferase, partial [Bacteroidota bacterium]